MDSPAGSESSGMPASALVCSGGAPRTLSPRPCGERRGGSPPQMGALAAEAAAGGRRRGGRLRCADQATRQVGLGRVCRRLGGPRRLSRALLCRFWLGSGRPPRRAGGSSELSRARGRRFDDGDRAAGEFASPVRELRYARGRVRGLRRPPACRLPQVLRRACSACRSSCAALSPRLRSRGRRRGGGGAGATSATGSRVCGPGGGRVLELCRQRPPKVPYRARRRNSDSACPRASAAKTVSPCATSSCSRPRRRLAS